MRPSFWNLLSFIVILAGFLLAGGFVHVYINPYSIYNPFPPPTAISIVILPTQTPSPQALPDLWTGVPATATNLPPLTETPLPTATIFSTEPLPSETPYIPVETQPEDYSKSVHSATPESLPLQSTIQPDDTPAVLQNPVGNIIVTAPVGVFNNTWQKLQAIPSFSWKIPDMDIVIEGYQVYFSTSPDGKPAAVQTGTHYSHPAITSGEYFFRVEVINIEGEVLDSSPYFVFRYDNASPTEPSGFGTTDPASTYAPYFTWVPSSDAHSGMHGGLAGYAIYQGTSKKCGKPVAFTTVTNWTPVSTLTAGTTEYFCIKALDAVGNESKWSDPVSFSHTP